MGKEEEEEGEEVKTKNLLSRRQRINKLPQGIMKRMKKSKQCYIWVEEGEEDEERSTVSSEEINRTEGE